jgi:ribonuclease HI
VLIPPSGPKLRYAARLHFLSTNNTAKYEAVLLGLRKLRALGVRRCIVKSDSQIVVDHIEKASVARDPNLTLYLAAVRRMEKHFEGFTLKHIPRSENSEADQLAKAAAQNEALPPDVFYQNLTEKAIREEEEKPKTVHAIVSEDWRSPIFAYLNGAYEELDKKEIDRMNSRTKHYKIIGGELYKTGIVAPWLKCISRQQGLQLLEEIHTGACGAHRGPHEIAHRALRQGFYWPTAAEDAKQLVRRCESCQMFAKNSSFSARPTKSIIPTWPLQRWGIDIVGILPTAPGNLRYAAVALEYFTKWIEAKPLANITSKTLQNFVWQRVICRFGVPAYITVDNGK